ncbi:MAG: site-specific integrase [Ruminococcus sp.]|nr:site-specific integrase [Ruminococcus sp.]
MPIIKDERITKKKNGLFRYRVRVNYTDANGKHQQVERLVWGKAEAEAMERQLEEEYRDKRATPITKMTLAELYDKYEEYHAMETRKTSHETVMKSLRLWVLPYIKNCRIDKLTKADFAAWKIELDKKDIALRTKQNAYKTFCSMLNYAVKMEYIAKNNLSVLGNFKDSVSLEKPPEELHYYTSEQFERYISAAKSECNTVIDWGFYVFFCIAFFTGCRKGEINALKWSDIDGNVFRIRRSITQKLKGGDVESAPKNKSSIRDLQIPEPLIKVLDEHKKRQQEAAPRHFTDDFRICGGEIPLRDSTIDHNNRRYAEKAGLPHIKIHCFRHSHVSLLANEGINIQEIARRLGHSNVQMTWNTYSHLYPREEERAVKILNRISLD